MQPAVAQADNPIFEQAGNYLQSRLSESLPDTARLDISFTPINNHILASPCDTPLSFQSTRAIKPGRFTLKARCSSPRNWSTRINGTLKIYRPVVTTERALPAGTALDQGNTLILEHSITSLRQGFYTDINPILGYETRMPLQRHQVIVPRHLTPPVLIHKGDEVTITAGTALLSVKVSGIALQDGRRNQQISIQNKRSGKVIRAKVIGSGEVRTR